MSFFLENLEPQGAPTQDNPDFAEGPDSSGVTSNLLGASLNNLTSTINGTNWTVSDIFFSDLDGEPLVIIEVLNRAALNLTVRMNTDTLDVFFEGRFYKPRRGPSVSVTGYINMSEDIPTFTAAGEFNYPFFAPSIPLEDPNMEPEEPEEDNDYDYEDDEIAKPPDSETGPTIPVSSPSPEPESSCAHADHKFGAFFMIFFFIL